MQSQTEEKTTLTLEEYEALMKRREPVNQWINNQIVIWGLFFMLLFFAGTLVYNQINDSINGADEKAAKALELGQENQNKNLELFKGLEASVAKNTAASEQTLKALETMNSSITDQNTRLFTIETSRYTDRDAGLLKDDLKDEDKAILRMVDQNKLDLKSVEARIVDIKTNVAAAKALAEQNARLLNDRGDFMSSTRLRLRSLEEAAMEE